jgi:hypothetical protein
MVGRLATELAAYVSNFTTVLSLQFLQMPPHVPPQRIGCHQTSFDIKYDPVNDSIDAFNIALAISGCP